MCEAGLGNWLCLSVGQSSCQLLLRIKKKSSSRLAKVFSDFILNTNNERKLKRMFLYLIQVKVILFAIIFSYFLIIGLLAPSL